MTQKNIINRTRRRVSLVLSFVILFEITLFLTNASARVENVPEFWKSDTVNPGEFVSYRFPNNIIFDINTTSKIELYIEYETRISNRQTLFSFNHNESISLNITSKTNMKNFGFPILQVCQKKEVFN